MSRKRLDCKKTLDQTKVIIDIRSRIGKSLFPIWYRKGIMRGRTKQRRRGILVLKLDNLSIQKGDQVLFFVNDQHLVKDAILIPSYPHAPSGRVISDRVKRFIPNSYSVILTPEFGAWTNVF